MDTVNRILLVIGIVFSCWLFYFHIGEGRKPAGLIGITMDSGNNEARNIEVVLPKEFWGNLEYVSEVNGMPIGKIIGHEVVAWHIYCDLKNQEKGGLRRRST